jgi:GR25 family glycosyltransferase involved in LPS biosynthesis
MQRLLVITPHLSTGGLPQFLYKKLTVLKDRFEIHVVEWDDITGGVLIVQRNLIKNLVGQNFYTLDKNKNQVLEIIQRVKPNIVHFEEFPETFIDHKLAHLIFSDKSYFITETTHGTGFIKEDKLFKADKTMFVSDFNYTQYESVTNNSDVIKHPIAKNRESILLELGLDPDYFHVLNVGLFTPGKNQAEVIEYAKRLTGKKIQFHFVGNQAGNFEPYWKPLMSSLPDNCRAWGERNDVYRFYSAMDLFLFTSKLENRPLSVLEALAYNMPVMMYNLGNYGTEFSNLKDVSFLTNFEQNLKMISSYIQEDVEEPYYTPFVELPTMPDIPNIPCVPCKSKVTAMHILTDIDTPREIRSMQSLTKLKDRKINYIPVISKRYTELPPADTCQYPEKISMEPGGKLTPGHYGCYLGHRKAFEMGLETNSDFLLIFECDAVIDVPMVDFMKKLNYACTVLQETDLFWFSFGFHNNTNIIEKNENYWTVNGFFGAHAYLIPRKSFAEFKEMYEKSKWNVADLLFVEKLSHKKAGIFEKPLTLQAAGYSILDKIETNDRH